MATTSRVEMMGNDNSQYVYGGSNGHRGHISSNFGSERPSFLRDSHEVCTQTLGISSSARVVAAGNAVSLHVDLPSLSQVLMLETIPHVEQKIPRQVDLRRAINAAVGLATDDPSLGSVQAKSLEFFGIEELKRVKASICENASRARERSRHLADAILKLDKYYSVLQSRKRSRSDAPVHERQLISLAAECTTTTPNLTKANYSGVPSHLGPVGLVDSFPRLADKAKAVNINKRLRTSVADVRVEGRPNSASMARSASVSDREKDFLRTNGSLSSGMEDKGRLVSSPGDLWEKSKFKGRRSGIKQDTLPSTAQIGALESEREHKWSERLTQDSRSRVNEGHGLRSGPVHGITSIHKAESTLHMNGLASRPVSKLEVESTVSSVERTERPLCADKERASSKSGVKPSFQEEAHSLSPTAITKGKAARAPRSNSVVPGNFAHLARVASFGDRDRPSAALAKVQMPSGHNNRKRPAPSRSSSPPVAQWVGQRPQKIARAARRGNLMPPVGPPLHDVANKLSDGNINCAGVIVGPRSNAGLISGSGIARRLSSSGMSSPKQNKARSERVNSSLMVSESDDSEEAIDGRLKEKLKKHGDWETKPPVAIQKAGNLFLPAKKSQVNVKEEVLDGVRRQGRSGRTPGMPKPLPVAVTVEEVTMQVTTKQLSSTKIGIEKPERLGRAILKNRTLDQKPLTRPRRPPGNNAELSGESDDDRDELVNAAQAAVNASALACSSEFWKKMEPYFTYLTADDISFLRNQVDSKDFVTSLCTPSTEARGKQLCFANGDLGSVGEFRRGTSSSSQYLHTEIGSKSNTGGGWLEKAFPLSQRLLAALINEAELPDYCGNLDETSHVNIVPPCGGPFMSSKSVKDKNSDCKAKSLDLAFDKYHSLEKYGDIGEDESTIANGHGVYVCTSPDLGDSLDETVDILVQVKPEISNRIGKCSAGNCDGTSVHTGSPTREGGDAGNSCSSTSKPGMTAWDVQYEEMSLDDRIRLELQIIGITVEQVPDLAPNKEEDIGIEVAKLKRELDDQVRSNEHRVQALEQAIMARKEAEERDRENLAMMKLVEIAYNKRKGSRGGASSNLSIKSSGAKGTRAATLAFVKRTLTRLRKFEAGESCFADATLSGRLFSNISRMSEGTQVAHAAVKGEETPAGKGLGMKSTGPSTVTEGAGMLDSPWLDGNERETVEIECNPPGVASASRGKWKDVLSMCDVGTIGNKAFGGTKGKRSERDRDGKSQGKEMAARNHLDGRARNSTGNVKGERKTKTKPRQKTAPLFKAMEGLGMPAELPKDVSSMPTSMQDCLEKSAKGKDKVEIVTAHGTGELPMSGTIDLSHLQIPEDLGVTDGYCPTQDLGSWLDFDDANLQDGHGELPMGLAVPMDDLSDLGMLM